jgi:1-phosphofructokinase
MKILTITLNPALDLIGHCSQLARGAVNRVTQSKLVPGGKGVNVSHVLASLGTPSTATGWLGDANQEPFNQLFNQEMIHDAFLRCSGLTRINVKLVESDNQGQETDINFPGLTLTPQDVQQLEQQLAELVDEQTWCVLAGSLPEGLPTTLYQDLISQLKTNGGQVIFDSSGAPFRLGIEAAPFLIKPNVDELSQWAGRPLVNDAAIIDAAHAICAKGIQHVLVSQGSQGALWVTTDRVLKAIPPTVTVVSCVGAGDSMVAATVYGLSSGWDIKRTLQYATAISAFTVTQVGVSLDQHAAIAPLIEQTVISLLTATAKV